MSRVFPQGFANSGTRMNPYAQNTAAMYEASENKYSQYQQPRQSYSGMNDRRSSYQQQSNQQSANHNQSNFQQPQPHEAGRTGPITSEFYSNKEAAYNSQFDQRNDHDLSKSGVNFVDSGQKDNPFAFQDSDETEHGIEYLRTLYGILLIQTIAVILAVWAAYATKNVLNKVSGDHWSLTIALVVAAAVTLGAFFFRNIFKRFPLNAIALLVQTIAFIVIFVHMLDVFNSEVAFLILVAFASIYFSLLCYVLTTKTELHIRSCTLFVTCSAVLVYQLFLIFTDLSYMTSIFILIGVIAWGYFVVYESQTRMSEASNTERNPITSAVTMIPDVFCLLLKVAELLRQTIIKESI